MASVATWIGLTPIELVPFTTLDLQGMYSHVAVKQMARRPVDNNYFPSLCCNVVSKLDFAKSTILNIIIIIQHNYLYIYTT